MKVVLRTRLKDLGDEGAVVQVADGYARNYLLPRGLAVAATDVELRRVREAQDRRSHRAAQALAEARAAGARLDGVTVTVTARAGDSGRLFGSVTSQDVAAAIDSQIGLQVDRRRIELPDPVKSLGTHAAVVRLHPEVAARLQVQVVEESAR